MACKEGVMGEKLQWYCGIGWRSGETSSLGGSVFVKSVHKSI